MAKGCWDFQGFIPWTPEIQLRFGSEPLDVRIYQHMNQNSSYFCILFMLVLSTLGFSPFTCLCLVFYGNDCCCEPCVAVNVTKLQLSVLNVSAESRHRTNVRM